MKRRQKAGFLSPRSSKITVTKKKERRRRETSDGYTLSFYNSYFGDAKGPFSDNVFKNPARYRSFSLSRNKKYIGNRPVEEAKRRTCYKRLIYKQFVQVSGLCDPQFLSYLSKRFTHLCRALYGDAILVHRFGAPIWPPEINKNIWSSLFL